MSTLRVKIFKRYVILWILAALVMAAFAVYSYQTIQHYQTYQIRSAETLQEQVDDGVTVGIVFGAAITPDGQPRSVLRERLDMAHELYQTKQINRLVVSGYNDTVHNDYNEPQAMRNYLLSLDVPPDAILVDEHGDNTRLTCQRSYQDLGIERAVLVTQATHMNRALYTCHQVGMEAYGYPADSVDSSWNYWHQRIREIFGNMKAVMETEVF